MTSKLCGEGVDLISIFSAVRNNLSTIFKKKYWKPCSSILGESLCRASTSPVEGGTSKFYWGWCLGLFDGRKTKFFLEKILSWLQEVVVKTLQTRINAVGKNIGAKPETDAKVSFTNGMPRNILRHFLISGTGKE